ncbi:MAG: hypothetical protein Q9M32_00660 [Sulfurimonas sp.]|nr:hypothetical protein [Sulfurimonas sp.]
MKYIIIIFKAIIKYIRMFFRGIWDFIFFFFGMPYEKQAKKLDLEKIDSVLRGPQDEKTSHQIYRANRAAPREENV